MSGIRGVNSWYQPYFGLLECPHSDLLLPHIIDVADGSLSFSMSLGLSTFGRQIEHHHPAWLCSHSFASTPQEEMIRNLKLVVLREYRGASQAKLQTN